MSNIAGSDSLVLQGRGGLHAVPFGGRLRVDHGLAAREALTAGRGIGPAHQWLVDDLLADGRLEVILPALFAALGPAEHADCPRARRHCAGPVAGRLPC